MNQRKVKKEDCNIDKAFTGIKRELRLIRWMTGIALAGVIYLVIEAFFM